jgi:hypothetical protein
MKRSVVPHNSLTSWVMWYYSCEACSPTGTIATRHLRHKYDISMFLQRMVSERRDCDMVLATSSPAAFISIITLYPIGPELHAIPSNSLISSGPLCSAPCHAIHSFPLSKWPGDIHCGSLQFSMGFSGHMLINYSSLKEIIDYRAL